MHLIGRHLRQNERLIKDRIRQLNFHLLIKIKLLFIRYLDNTDAYQNDRFYPF